MRGTANPLSVLRVCFAVRQTGNDVREGGTEINGVGEQLRAAGPLEEQERRASVFHDPANGGGSIAGRCQSVEHLRGRDP